MTASTDITPRDPGAPLAGRSVVVTRAADQAGGLVAPLVALGAEVVVLPVIEVADPLDTDGLDDAIAHLERYDWIVLTSVNGVDRFVARLVERGRGVEALRIPSVAVVGSATAARLREIGVEPALVPADFRAEGLVRAFEEIACRPGLRVLVPRAAEAREVLPDALREMGCEVDVVPVYRLVTASPDPAVVARIAAGDVDAITFASGGTARRFLDLLGDSGFDVAAALAGVTIASIGPVTTHVLVSLGLHADVEAPESTSASLADALGRHFAKASLP